MKLSIDSVEERERFLARVSGLESGEQKALIEKNSEKEFEERERFVTRVQGLDSEEQRAFSSKSFRTWKWRAESSYSNTECKESNSWKCKNSSWNSSKAVKEFAEYLRKLKKENLKFSHPHLFINECGLFKIWEKLARISFDFLFISFYDFLWIFVSFYFWHYIGTKNHIMLDI